MVALERRQIILGPEAAEARKLELDIKLDSWQAQYSAASISGNKQEEKLAYCRLREVQEQILGKY